MSTAQRTLELHARRRRADLAQLVVCMRDAVEDYLCLRSEGTEPDVMPLLRRWAWEAIGRVELALGREVRAKRHLQVRSRPAGRGCE